jgi:hypothetical protein
MGSGLSYSIKIAAGTGGPAVALEFAYRRGHYSEPCAECQNIKIFEGLSNSKNMVFNVKKLLNVGLGLALRRNSGKNRCERNERQI